MFGNMGDMAKMLEGMQGNVSKLKEELESKTFSVKTGGGLIEVEINGRGEITDLNIDDSLLSDKDSLQILLIGAINDAYSMVQKNQENSAMGMLGGLGGVNPFGGN